MSFMIFTESTPWQGFYRVEKHALVTSKCIYGSLLELSAHKSFLSFRKHDFTSFYDHYLCEPITNLQHKFDLVHGLKEVVWNTFVIYDNISHDN